MSHALNRIGESLPPLSELVATEVRRVLAASVGPGATQGPLQVQRLKSRRAVYRVQAQLDGDVQSLVVKQLEPRVAHRARLVADRWLPALELGGAAPALLGVVAGPEAESVWHIYDDAGIVSLDGRASDAECVTAAIDLIAGVHLRGARHPLLAECRRDGDDFGIHYFTTNVGDALRLLEALHPTAARLSHEEAALRDQLRGRLEGLLADAPRRARFLAEAGGPETLLHGDLWTSNIVISRDGERVAAQLVDWDHVGVGPISYDLSTFLYRFDPTVRPWVVDRYRRAIAPAGWRLPPVPVLNVLSDTAECARCANRIIWPVIALLQEGAAWAFAELREIEQWFEALEPVLDA